MAIKIFPKNTADSQNVQNNFNINAVQSLIDNLHSQHSQELLHILSEIKSAKENDDKKKLRSLVREIS